MKYRKRVFESPEKAWQLLIENGDADPKFRERHEKATKARIFGVYKSLELLRKVPPPENIALALLYGLQNAACFMCWAKGMNPGLERERGRNVEDHCHKTGMVRALLCKSCNTQEGQGGSSLWKFYRKYAPANGWYCRYFGYGAQWQGNDDDPVLNRVSLPKTILTESFCLGHPQESLDRYQQFAEALLPGYRPNIAICRFDSFGNLILGEANDAVLQIESMIVQGDRVRRRKQVKKLFDAG